MSKPEELRLVAENTLNGLTADDSMKFRILQKAAGDAESKRVRILRPVSVLCTVLAVMLVAVIALNTLQAVPSAGPGNINSFTAGSADSDAHLFPEGFDPDSVTSVSFNGFIISDSGKCTELVSTLIERASETNPPEISAGSPLEISDGRGITVTFTAEAPFLIGDDGRTWFCSEFFDAFEIYTGK